MSTHGSTHGSQEGLSPQGGMGAGVTYGFAFGTGVSLVAWSTGFTLEVEGEKREKPFNTRLMIKGSPEPHPARPLCRGRDGQHPSDPSTILCLQEGCQRRHLQVGQQLAGAEEGIQPREKVDGGVWGYSQCYPWDRGHRWDPGVRRDHGHRGSRERQQCQEHPRRGRGGGEGAARTLIPEPGRGRGTLTVAPLAPG